MNGEVVQSPKSGKGPTAGRSYWARNEGAVRQHFDTWTDAARERAHHRNSLPPGLRRQRRDGGAVELVRLVAVALRHRAVRLVEPDNAAARVGLVRHAGVGSGTRQGA